MSKRPAGVSSFDSPIRPPFCHRCKFWGDEWVKDLSRKCLCPATADKFGQPQWSTGMCATCEHFEEDPKATEQYRNKLAEAVE